MFRNRCIVDFTDILKSLPHPKTADDRVVTFEQLADEEPSRLPALLTFASVKFRKFADRVATGDMNMVRYREQLFEAHTPPGIDHIYEPVPRDSHDQRVYDFKRDEVLTQRHACDQRLDACIPLGKSLKSLYLRKVALVEMDLAFGDGDSSFPSVRRLTCLASNSSFVIEGQPSVPYSICMAIQAPTRYSNEGLKVSFRFQATS